MDSHLVNKVRAGIEQATSERYERWVRILCSLIENQNLARYPRDYDNAVQFACIQLEEAYKECHQAHSNLSNMKVKNT